MKLSTNKKIQMAGRPSSVPSRILFVWLWGCGRMVVADVAASGCGSILANRCFLAFAASEDTRAGRSTQGDNGQGDDTTYQLFPTILLPFFSASLSNCAALNCKNRKQGQRLFNAKNFSQISPIGFCSQTVHQRQSSSRE